MNKGTSQKLNTKNEHVYVQINKQHNLSVALDYRQKFQLPEAHPTVNQLYTTLLLEIFIYGIKC